MATKYELNAVIRAENDTNAAFTGVREEIRKTREELRTLDDTVNIQVDVESVRDDLDKLKGELKSFSEDIDINVGLDTSKARSQAKAFATDLKRALRDEKIDVSLNTARAKTEAKTLAADLKKALRDEKIDVSLDTKKAKAEARGFSADLKKLFRDEKVSIDVDTAAGRAKINQFQAFAKRASRDIKIDVDVDTGAAIVQLGALRAATGAASREVGVLRRGYDSFALSVVTAARVLTASGFMVQLAAIPALVSAGITALRAIGGSLAVVGSMATSAGVGAGLLGAAIYRLVNATKEGEKWTKELSKEWKALQSQFTGSSSVFDKAAKSLAPLGTQMLRLANSTMPALGKEANEVAKAVTRAFDNISRNVGSNDRNSLNRILDNASKVMGSLVSAAGKAGAAIANIFGNRQVIKAAQDLAEWIDEIAGKFLNWTQSKQGIETINDLVQDARKFIEDLGEALDPVAKAMGKFGKDDVETLGKALQGVGRFVGGVIEGLENFMDAVGAAQKFTEKYGLRLDQLGGTFRKLRGSVTQFAGNIQRSMTQWINNTASGIARWVTRTTRSFTTWARNIPRSISRALQSMTRPMTQWINNTASGIARWVTRTTRSFTTWVRNIPRNLSRGLQSMVESIGKWASDTAGDFADWVTDTAGDFADWVTDTTKSFTDWAADVLDAFAQWAEDTWKGFQEWGDNVIDTFVDWADETLGGFDEWIGETFDNFTTWVEDVIKLMQDRFPEVTKTILDTLDAALGPLDEWVQDAFDILNKIFEFLGIGPGEEREGKRDRARSKPSSDPNNSIHNNPGGGGRRPGRRHEGGVYDDDVRMMATGGIVDASGMATAMATGLSQELSKGAVWQEAVGGITDGMAPRVVYGEVAPDGQAGKEAFIREGRPVQEQLPYLVEAARWFGLKVGAGPEQPHAHLPESAAEKLFASHPSNVVKMAPGGMLFGVPGGSITADYQQYIEGYQFSADSRHKGIDVAGSESYATYAGRQQDVPDWSAGVGAAIDFTAKDGSTQSMVHGHLSSTPGAGAEIRPNMLLGSITNEGYGWTPHMHLQAYTEPVLGTGYTHNEPPLTDPRNTWEAASAGGEIPPPGQGSSVPSVDIWNQAKRMAQSIGQPDMGGGPYFTDVAKAAGETVLDAALAWIKNHLPSFRLPWDTSGNEGAVKGWIKEGLTYGGAFEPSTSNIEKLVSLSWEESRHDPKAINDSGAAGLLQMMPETFLAFAVQPGEDAILNPVDNVASSSRYQLDRYGTLQEHAPYSAGGIALRPQIASLGEHGEEFVMPLHDPEASRRFMGFLENAALERAEKGNLPWMRDPEMAFPSGPPERDDDHRERQQNRIVHEMRRQMVEERRAAREDIAELSGAFVRAIGGMGREVGKEINDAIPRQVRTNPEVRRSLDKIEKVRDRNRGIRGPNINPRRDR